MIFFNINVGMAVLVMPLTLYTYMEERKMIYLCLAHMSDEGFEQKYVKEAFDTNWVVPMGPNVNAFEHDLEEFVNCIQIRNEELGMRN